MTQTFWRAGRGSAAGRTVTESTPGDELRPAAPAVAVLPERTPLGQFTPTGAALAARRKRARVGRVGRRSYETDPEFAPWERWGKAWASHRRGELAKCHGGEISAEVGALVEDEGLCRARSRFAHAQYAATKDREWAREARAESTEARQLAKDAWEIAAREGAVRPRLDAQGRPALPLGMEWVDDDVPASTASNTTAPTPGASTAEGKGPA